jgi:hypothetical protein
VILGQISDRVALERENRELTSRAPLAGSSSIEGRLDAIDKRLARIETLLTGR